MSADPWKIAAADQKVAFLTDMIDLLMDGDRTAEAIGKTRLLRVGAIVAASSFMAATDPMELCRGFAVTVVRLREALDQIEQLKQELAALPAKTGGESL